MTWPELRFGNGLRGSLREVGGGRGRAEVGTQQNAREDFTHERGHLEEPGGDQAADADGGEEHDEGAEVVPWRSKQASG